MQHTPSAGSSAAAGAAAADAPSRRAALLLAAAAALPLLPLPARADVDAAAPASSDIIEGTQRWAGLGMQALEVQLQQVAGGDATAAQADPGLVERRRRFGERPGFCYGAWPRSRNAARRLLRSRMQGSSSFARSAWPSRPPPACPPGEITVPGLSSFSFVHGLLVGCGAIALLAADRLGLGGGAAAPAAGAPAERVSGERGSHARVARLSPSFAA